MERQMASAQNTNNDLEASLQKAGLATRLTSSSLTHDRSGSCNYDTASFPNLAADRRRVRALKVHGYLWCNSQYSTSAILPGKPWRSRATKTYWICFNARHAALTKAE